MPDPVLGSTLLEEQPRRLEPTIHVYGHGHTDNVLGYPQGHAITAKRLRGIDAI